MESCWDIVKRMEAEAVVGLSKHFSKCYSQEGVNRILKTIDEEIEKEINASIVCNSLRAIKYGFGNFEKVLDAEIFKNERRALIQRIEERAAKDFERRNLERSF